MGSEISRRSFLLGAASVAALAACGGDDDPDISVDRPSTSAGAATGPLSVVFGSFNPVAGLDERIAFAVLTGAPARPADVPKGDVAVTFTKAGGGAAPSKRLKAVSRRDGIEERPYWSIRHTFAEPGNYEMVVDYAGAPAKAAIEIVDAAKVKSPLPGQKLPAVASPTAGSPLGVNPICTRKPACPLHDVSLDAALKQSKPLIVLFSTPALCQSVICGPVLDLLVEAKPQYEGKATAIHAEVFTDLTGKAATDTFKAFNSQIEPLFYFAKADGTIVERFDGPVDRAELKEAITRLLA